MKRSLFFALLVTTIAASAPARADDARARADALFQRGRDLFRRGDTAEACDAFAESQQLDPAVGTLLNLAACHEKQGRTASAWAEFKDVAEQAARAGQAQREKYARERVAELGARLSMLVVTVERRDAPTHVLLDGREIAKELLGTEIPVDPGDHALEAYEDGAPHEVERVHVVAGPVRIERVLLRRPPAPLPAPTEPPKAEPVTSATLAPPPSAIPSAIPTPRDVTVPASPTPWSRSPKLGYLGVATGVIGIGFGAYFGVRAIGEKADGDALCRGHVCTSDGLTHHDAARTDAWISTGAFALGALGAGLAVYSFTSRGGAGPTALRAAPIVSRDYVGFAAEKGW